MINEILPIELDFETNRRNPLENSSSDVIKRNYLRFFISLLKFDCIFWLWGYV